MTDRADARRGSDPAGIVFGNASEDSLPYRSWLMGHFVPEPDGPRHSREVEVKWGTYAEGFGESDWTACRSATSLVILVSGRHEIALPHRIVTLEHAGDYLIWGPGVPHRWRALEDCLVITIRWPSVPGDTVAVPDEEVEWLRAAWGS